MRNQSRARVHPAMVWNALWRRTEKEIWELTDTVNTAVWRDALSVRRGVANSVHVELFLDDSY